jgi:hypothetical protein
MRVEKLTALLNADTSEMGEIAGALEECEIIERFENRKLVDRIHISQREEVGILNPSAQNHRRVFFVVLDEIVQPHFGDREKMGNIMAYAMFHKWNLYIKCFR